MKRLVSALCFAMAIATAGPAVPQPAPVNEMGVTMGHLHLNSADIEANKKIFVALGGTPQKNGNLELVKFPGVIVFLNRGAAAPKPVGGTVGTVVNHVGFLVPNVQASMAQWKAAGVPVAPGGNGRLDQAFVTTPDGIRIEILEDKAQTVPIKHHHIHWAVPENDIPKLQNWYVVHFGAKPGMRGQNVAADLPGANLSFSKSDTPTVPTAGHSLDHIGFDIKGLDGFVRKLEADGVKIERPYEKNARTGAAMAFVSDPWGTLIELNERPNPL